MNRESERKRLVGLITEGQPPFNPLNEVCIEKLADHLLDDGWMRPPVKVGQTVYCIIKGFEKPLEGFVHKVELYDLCSKFTVWIKGYLAQQFTDKSIGKTVFTSREDAEKALNNVEKGNSCKGGVEE